MIKINYPEKKPAIKDEGGKEWIFCIVRKKWMVLTPEEWVRQNLLLYFIEVMKYPASLMAVEKQLMLGDLKKRFDIVLYRDEVPFMLIECKEMNVPIDEKTMEQALRYNINLQAAYFIITNGNSCFGFKRVNHTVETIHQFPTYR